VRAAAAEGLARADVGRLDDDELASRLQARTWEAAYRPIRAV
jgi:hypothetical protein